MLRTALGGPSEPAVMQRSAVPACTVLDQTIKKNEYFDVSVSAVILGPISDKLTNFP